MFLPFLFGWLIIRLLIVIIKEINLKLSRSKSVKMKTIKYTNGLFVNNFIDPKVLFVTRFKSLANIGMIRFTDSTKAYAVIMEKFSNEITEVYQYNSFDYYENKTLFYVTIFVLKNKRIVEIGFDYTEILYTNNHYSWANALLSDLANCRMEERTKVMGFARSEVMN